MRGKGSGMWQSGQVPGCEWLWVCKERGGAAAGATEAWPAGTCLGAPEPVAVRVAVCFMQLLVVWDGILRRRQKWRPCFGPHGQQARGGLWGAPGERDLAEFGQGGPPGAHALNNMINSACAEAGACGGRLRGWVPVPASALRTNILSASAAALRGGADRFAGQALSAVGPGALARSLLLGRARLTREAARAGGCYHALLLRATAAPPPPAGRAPCAPLWPQNNFYDFSA